MRGKWGREAEAVLTSRFVSTSMDIIAMAAISRAAFFE
jgi:hypothetical protein